MLGRVDRDMSEMMPTFDECINIDENDWEVYLFKGLSYKYLRVYEQAIICFKRANEIKPNDQTYLELGKLYSAQ